MRITTLTLVIICFGVLNLPGQDLPRIYDPSSDRSFNMLPNYISQIGNYVTEKIEFSLSFDAINWKNFSAKKNKPIWIDLRKGNKKPNAQAYFRICTSGIHDCLTYRIKGKNRYRVYWNSDRKKWDLSLNSDN